jgi:hypothetical protein
MNIESVILIISLAIPGIIIITTIFINYEKNVPEYLEDKLLRTFPNPILPEIINRRVDFSKLSSLPQPVENYLKNVLTDGMPFISMVKTRQTGKLRTNVSTSANWLSFNAKQFVTPITNGFVWCARIKTPLRTWLRVSDGYISGIGVGKVDLLSIIPIVTESNIAELNSGSLYRYLAEAVWYPTALLPESGVTWTPIDDYRAVASLTDNGTTVSLEFRFNKENEVVGIYTTSRFKKAGGKYIATAWEGHFNNYTTQDGLRVPLYGEVGWYENNEWQCTWMADISNIKFNFYAV